MDWFTGCYCRYNISKGRMVEGWLYRCANIAMWFSQAPNEPKSPQEQAPGLTLGCFSTEMSHEFRGSGWNHGTGSLCPRGGPLADSLSHVYIGQLFGLGGISSLNWFEKKSSLWWELFFIFRCDYCSLLYIFWRDKYFVWYFE